MPPEIDAHIYRLLRPPALLNLMLVSKVMVDTVMPALYATIFICGHSVKHILAALQARPEKITFINRMVFGWANLNGGDFSDVAIVRKIIQVILAIPSSAISLQNISFSKGVPYPSDWTERPHSWMSKYYKDFFQLFARLLAHSHATLLHLSIEGVQSIPFGTFNSLAKLKTLSLALTTFPTSAHFRDAHVQDLTSIAIEIGDKEETEKLLRVFSAKSGQIQVLAMRFGGVLCFMLRAPPNDMFTSQERFFSYWSRHLHRF